MRRLTRRTGTAAAERIAVESSADVAPAKGRVPVAISYSRTPVENTSLAAVGGCPATCSGEWYGSASDGDEVAEVSMSTAVVANAPRSGAVDVGSATAVPRPSNFT